METWKMHSLTKTWLYYCTDRQKSQNDIELCLLLGINDGPSLNTHSTYFDL